MAGKRRRPKISLGDASIGSVVSVLTVTGLLIYGIVYYALWLFYHDLGLTANELGRTQAAIIADSAVVLLAIVLFLVPLLSIIAWAAATIMREQLKDDPSRVLEKRIWLRGWLLAALVFAIVVIDVVAVKPAGLKLICYLMVLVIGYWVAARLGKRLATDNRPANDDVSISLGKAAVGAWIFLALVGIPVFAFSITKGEALWSTGDPSLVSDYPSRVLLGSVKCVRLTWTGAQADRPADLPNHAVIRLGSNEGMLVTLDENPIPKADPVLQWIPLGDVIVSNLPGHQCKRQVRTTKS